MIALEACLILETITAIPLSGAHSCLAQDSAQQLRARRARRSTVATVATKLRRSAAQHGGVGGGTAAAAAVSFFSCIQIRLLHEQAALHGVQFGPLKLGQLLFVCLWRLDMAMIIFKLW
jgi:hypothetical protein